MGGGIQEEGYPMEGEGEGIRYDTVHHFTWRQSGIDATAPLAPLDPPSSPCNGRDSERS